MWALVKPLSLLVISGQPLRVRDNAAEQAYYQDSRKCETTIYGPARISARITFHANARSLIDGHTGTSGARFLSGPALLVFAVAAAGDGKRTRPSRGGRRRRRSSPSRFRRIMARPWIMSASRPLQQQRSSREPRTSTPSPPSPLICSN